MNEYEMVVMVVFIIAVAAIIIAVISARGRRMSDVPATDMVADNRRLNSEVATLKERVAVLERIATDKNHRLDHEFEQLRDS